MAIKIKDLLATITISQLIANKESIIIHLEANHECYLEDQFFAAQDYTLWVQEASTPHLVKLAKNNELAAHLLHSSMDKELELILNLLNLAIDGEDLTSLLTAVNNATWT